MLKVINSIQEWKQIKASQLINQTIGFVPTMGNLHVGHLSLCKKSASENNVTVMTIYVNPTQFNDKNDLQKYPRTLEMDLTLLRETKFVDYCLILTDEEVYADDYVYQVSELYLSQMMEGIFRPGHFTGMLTVVLKLLIGVAPNRAYFGEKDYQQYRLIDGMKKAFFLDCDIIACPTVREESGLPFSSRNSRLSEEEKQKANVFSSIFLKKYQSCEEILQQLQQQNIGVDYSQEIEGRRFIAVRIGDIRLLDNYPLEG
jgi:pantoate--beta-alanine ligase